MSKGFDRLGGMVVALVFVFLAVVTVIGMPWLAYEVIQAIRDGAPQRWAASPPTNGSLITILLVFTWFWTQR